jgi:hypothetical protein
MREAPFWFITTALAIILVIFLSCAVFIIAVDRVIVSRDGLALSISSNPNTRSYIPDDSYNVTLDFNFEFLLYFPGANGKCLFTASNGSRILSYSSDVSSDLPLTSPMFVGQHFDLDTISNDSLPVECPPIAFLSGNSTWNSTASPNLTPLVCSQGIEQVPITVNYNNRDTHAR